MDFLLFHSECKATLSDDSGVVKSPKFPQNYENNIDCTWLIELGNDKFIEIEFLNFDLEHHYNCKLVPFVCTVLLIYQAVTHRFLEQHFKGQF